MHLGLAFVDVEAGCVDGSVVKGRGERRLVDDRAAGGVDEHGRLFHALEFGLADEVAGHVGQRQVQAQHVAFGEERFE
ncbi:MAG: hypothetical protein BWY66_01558 [bacterium ADurb.Bin374]|nr:MAG: hypothetical protein BWY66_01558 [bacterium ADurb.Bin374]